jgi:acetyl-CoA/propionyl-CoA carboxylase biotin carboxyl carrier protein
MLRALDELHVGGVTTLVGFHRALISHPCFVDGATCHGVVESEQLAERAKDMSESAMSTHLTTSVAGGADGARLREQVKLIELDGRRYEVRMLEPEAPWAEVARRRRERGRGAGAGPGGKDAVVSPMQGTVLAVEVAEGDEVTAGQVLCVVEAMKMENEVHAHRDGVVRELSVAPGEPVSTGQVICVVAGE